MVLLLEPFRKTRNSSDQLKAVKQRQRAKAGPSDDRGLLRGFVGLETVVINVLKSCNKLANPLNSLDWQEIEALACK